MGLLDDMRNAVRDDAIGYFMPDDPNFELVAYSGGTKNHLGERAGATVTRTPFTCVETTKLGDLDDTERTERVVGGQAQGEIVLKILDDIVSLGDRVERLADGEPYEVVNIDSPRLNNVVVVYYATIRKQVA